MMEIFPSMYFSDNFFVYWKKSEYVSPIFILVAKDVGRWTKTLQVSLTFPYPLCQGSCSVNATSVYENYGLLSPIIEVDNHFSSFNIG